VWLLGGGFAKEFKIFLAVVILETNLSGPSAFDITAVFIRQHVTIFNHGVAGAPGACLDRKDILFVAYVHYGSSLQEVL
jgi:hypothetical protein